jgi:endo-1,4-beta-xylanase
VAQQDSTIVAIAALGVKVMITELDIDVLPRATRGQGSEVSLRADFEDGLNPFAMGVPDSVQVALAQRYSDLVGVYLKHRNVITRVTFWGVTDGDSWLNDWPVRGRANYPLLFDRQGRPKLAFDSVVRVARRSLTRQ